MIKEGGLAEYGGGVETIRVSGNVRLEYERIKERLVFKVADRKFYSSCFEKLISIDAGNGFSYIFGIDLGDCHLNISREMADTFKYSKEDLIRDALINTQERYPAVFYDMRDALSGFALDSDKAPLLDEVKEADKNGGLFILTNKAAQNGAACLYYPGVQKKIAEILDSDYYVIPCSKHELIITSCDTDMTPEYIKHMVYEINRSEVEDSDVLSDTVLKYDRELEALVIV